MSERLSALRARWKRESPSAAPADERLVEIEQATAGADLRAALDEFAPDVVLADVFDTLLLRRVHPEDVKRLAARQLAVRLNLITSPTNLYSLRNRLERQLCLSAADRGFDLEFRIRELAGAMFTELARSDTALQGLGEQVWVDELVSVELEVERQVQGLDQHVVAALDEHVARGGRLVLVSDFYLAHADVAALLDGAGFGPDRYERLFVSSESLVTKRGGALYDQVLAELGVAPPRLLMVGDNAHSDGHMAQTRGIRAIVLRRDHQRARYAALAQRCSRLATISASIDEVLHHDPAPSPAPDVFQELALTLAYSVVRLHEALHRDGHSDVLFLAREGQMLERLVTAYDKLTVAPERRLSSSYAYVSRRATFLPSLGPLDDEHFFSLFRQYRALSVREFLLNLGFHVDAADSIALAAGLDPDVVHSDLPTSEAFVDLQSSFGFRSAYEQRRLAQRELLQAHLGVPGADRLALVDVGWKGTIQDHLAGALAPTDGIDGYYLGLVAAGADSPSNRKQGVLFDFRAAEGRYYDVFDENRALYEVALTAPHGSTAGYRRSSDGRAEPVLEPMTAGERAAAEQVALLQQRLLPRTELFLALLADAVVDEHWLLRQVARRHARMVLFPRRAELAWFRALTHEENFGLFRQTAFGRAQTPTPRERTRNVVGFARQPRATLTASFWPRLGLSESGLGPLGLPYGAYKARRFLHTDRPAR